MLVSAEDMARSLSALRRLPRTRRRPFSIRLTGLAAPVAISTSVRASVVRRKSTSPLPSEGSTRARPSDIDTR